MIVQQLVFCNVYTGKFRTQVSYPRYVRYFARKEKSNESSPLFLHACMCEIFNLPKLLFRYLRSNREETYNYDSLFFSFSSFKPIPAINKLITKNIFHTSLYIPTNTYIENILYINTHAPSREIYVSQIILLGNTQFAFLVF